MPIPLIIGAAAAAAGVYGAVKGVRGAIDHSNAKDINNDASSIVESANQKVEDQRKSTNNTLEDYGQRKLRAFNGVVAEFIEAFERVKNVELGESPFGCGAAPGRPRPGDRHCPRRERNGVEDRGADDARGARPGRREREGRGGPVRAHRVLRHGGKAR